MSWIFYALLAPAVYSVINFTDKYIVEKELKDYSCVPVFSGIVAIVFGTCFWFFTGMATLSLRDGALIMASGVLSVLSYVVYLRALSEEETSNVTIFFQVTPIITLILSLIFLHEPIALKQYIGFFIVLAVSIGMAWQPGEKMKLSRAFWYIMLWDLSLAVSVIIVKFVVEQASFIKIFLQTNCWFSFLNRAPGKRCDSQRIWKPLQTPKTLPPACANSITLCIIGLNRAIAPQRR